MKKKSRFLVHIALIALSLCIMVYGVYAAKSASLTVSGTIGFTAHNGSIKYGAITVNNALTETGAKFEYTGTSTDTNHLNTDIALGEFYFDDLTNSTKDDDGIKPITIVFNVYNYSLFEMKITDVASTQLKNASDTVVAGLHYSLTTTYSNTTTNKMSAATKTGENVTAGTDYCTVTISLTLDSYTDSTKVATALAATPFKIVVNAVKA